MMSDFVGKKILFVGIGFYDYEKAIKLLLEKKGAIVSYLISVQRSLMIRFFERIGMNKIAYSLKQKKRTTLIEASPEGNDIVFIIKGEELTQSDIDYLRKRNPDAKFVLYLWDSLVRHHNKDLLLRNFDNIWSFDRKDCELNKKLKFRPLFYRDTTSILPKKYVLSFVGWMHSDRWNIVRQLKEELQKREWKYCMKLYTGRLSYYIGRLSGKLKKMDDDLIVLNPIPYKTFQDITSSSTMVLDIAHAQQSGLTMRSIEALAAGCHLLTTNLDIMNYPQISNQRYTLISREKVELPPYIPETTKLETDFRNYFSLEGFINEIFFS